MHTLRTLDAAQNGLSGRLPLEWGRPGRLSHLTNLMLAGNALEGGLPEEWGQHGSLQRLVAL